MKEGDFHPAQEIWYRNIVQCHVMVTSDPSQLLLRLLLTEHRIVLKQMHAALVLSKPPAEVVNLKSLVLVQFLELLHDHLKTPLLVGCLLLCLGIVSVALDFAFQFPNSRISVF